MLVNVRDILFGPDDDIEHFVIDEIDKAKRHLNVMVFWLTWKPIADAILRAYKRRVKVKLLLDVRSTEEKMKDMDVDREIHVPSYLIENGLGKEMIRVYNGELLHHKIILLDGEKTLLGSCNFFNASITRHEENYMLVEGENFNSIFMDRFKNLWNNKSFEYWMEK